MTAIKKAKVVLFDDGSYLFWSAGGGKWKEVEAGKEMTGSDFRILRETSPEGLQAIVEHRLEHGYNGSPDKATTLEEEVNGILQDRAAQTTKPGKKNRT